MKKKKKQKSALEKTGSFFIYVFTLPIVGGMLFGIVGLIIGAILGILGLVSLFNQGQVKSCFDMEKVETNHNIVKNRQAFDIIEEEEKKVKKEKQEEIKMAEENNHVEEKEVYKKKWFAWVLLLAGGLLLGVIAGIGWLMIPVFFYLIWKYQHHGKKMRIVLTVLLSIVLITSVSGNGDKDDLTLDNDVSAENEVEEEEIEVVEVVEEESKMFNLSLVDKTEVNDDLVIIKGETNLLDGSVLKFEIENYNFDSWEHGEIIVNDGSFSKEIDITEFDGDLLVWYSLNPSHQSDDLLLVYGEGLEFIESDYLVEISGLNYVDVEIEFKRESEYDSYTLSQKNAISSADDYINYTAFSKSRLIEQLEYEGYSNEDAILAVNYITVDWKEQAVIEAQDYLDYSSFSRSGLIDQLIYSGHSKENATHAVDEIGL